MAPDTTPMAPSRLAAYKGHLTRAINACTTEFTSANPTLQTLELKRDKLETAYNRYSTAFFQFEDESDIQGEAYQTANQSYQRADDEYLKCIGEINDLIKDLRPATNTVNVSTTSSKVKLKLPTIELPKFSGKREDWPPFWESFAALVHNDKDMDDVVKFTYLRQSLKGEAASQIKGFTGVGSDYANAVGIISKYYADKKAIRFELTNKLVMLKSPKCNREELLNFHIAYSTLLRQLQDYVDDLDSSAWVIDSILQGKLPKEFTKYLYDRFHVNFFSESEMSEGIQDFVKRYENDHPYHGNANQYNSVSRFSTKTQSQKSLSIPPVTMQHVSVNQQTCIFCKSSHSSRHCTQYATVRARRNRLESLGRCKRCCLTNHKADDCKISTFKPCPTCKGTSHHGFMCLQLQPQSTDVNANLTHPVSPNQGKWKPKSHRGAKKSNPHENVTSDPDETPTGNIVMSTLGTKSTNSTIHESTTPYPSVALPTAMASIQGTQNRTSVQVRCFFDQGSQRTFVTRSLKESLKLEPVSKILLSVHHGFNNTTAPCEYDIVCLIVTLGKNKRRITAVVVPALPNAIQTPGLMSIAAELRSNDVDLADDYSSDTVRDTSLLIGGDFYGKFINGLTNRCGVNLLKTSAGYVIYGPVPSNVSDATQDVNLQNVMSANFTVFTDEPPVHQLWDLDSIGIDANALSPQDDIAYQTYLDTVYYQDRYFVRLPWKRDHPPLPTNYKMAFGQLHALHKSLANKPEMLNHYHKVISDQLEQNFIEEVPNAKVQEDSHYIPHHAVLKNSVTTPLRIVYNCSAKASKDVPSLNECLMKGPALTEKLGNILVTFRTNHYAFSADISKAFLRIGLQEVDRDFTRFLWLEDPFDPKSRIITYRFSSVLFGATSSPFLLQATLDFHLRRSDSPFKEIIRESFYVDNLIGTMNSDKDLAEFYHEANKELSLANMPLREWSSNCPTMQQLIRTDQKGVETDLVNVLGLQWNVKEDTIQLHHVQFQADSETQTKRTLLSNVSKVFDPLGFCIPVTIRGKILLQSAWKLNVGWDEILPSTINDTWVTLADDLCQLSSINIPRSTCSEDTSNSIIVFCDASTSAYGAAAYIISGSHSNLLIAKAKVAPLKARSLPQLELTALQLGAQMVRNLIKVLKHIHFTNITIFSDNEAAIQWIRNDNCSMPYVKNRVHKIRELTPTIPILYVSSEDNPADLLTRGVSFKKFFKKKLDFWFHGPVWILDRDNWPAQKPFVVVQELCTDVLPQQTTITSQPSPIDYTRFSSFTSLIKTTQYVFKFLRLDRSPEQYWIKFVQLLEYPQVYQILRNKSESMFSTRVSSLLNPIKKFINDLGLYLDSSGVIRSHDRLRYSLYHKEDQILLPSNSYITTLIILQAHQATKHGGMTETLCQVRLQFWIPKGRSTVKRVIKSCPHCRRIFAIRISKPSPPPLPRERVEFVRPFHSIGVDYTGSILIRDKSTKEFVKVYICLFTCTTSRAVHLELAQDLSATTFLNLFRRFCARYSTPKLIISDNATNFKANASFFKILFEEPMVKQHFEDQRIKWKFIAPLTPNEGGFYERLIGVVKGCLRKSLFKRILSWDELTTLLMEIEQCVNNRPLTYLSSALPDVEALTPNHLLKGEITQIMPTVSTTDVLDPLYLDHDQLNLQYTHLSNAIDRFVQVWSKDYLAALKERHFGNVPPTHGVPIKVGDIVLLSNDLPRNRWPLGRITKVYPDSDNIVRHVDVFSQGHTSLRTVDKLYSLELSQPDLNTVPIERETLALEDSSPHTEGGAVCGNEIQRPKREAARRAEAHRHRLIDADQL